jgi:hypothetical protein
VEGLGRVQRVREDAGRANFFGGLIVAVLG